MTRRKSINNFQVGRAGWERDRKPKFVEVINKMLEEKGYNFKFYEIEEHKGLVPDYEVKEGENVIAYFEAEFPLSGRWRTGEDFRFPTIRWPKRKFDHYGQWSGLYNGKPLFMITIKGDLTDAYYIDAKTWFKRGKEEKVRSSIFYAINKDDTELGHGLEELADYMLNRIEEVYKDV